MGHVVKRLPWCDIDINTESGHVFLQQKWKYMWLIKPGVAIWSEKEKTDFHNRADSYIWAAWSNRATLGVSGTSDFAKRYATKGVSIALDIRRVASDEHWNVNVKKILPPDFERSNILWDSRTIYLDTNDFQTRNNCLGTPKICYSQTPVAHEFGHAAGNASALGRGDEYNSTNPHYSDNGSIMNVGSQLRARHFQTILDELNTMIVGASFSVKSIL